MIKRRNFPKFRREDSEELVLHGVVGVLGGLRGYVGDDAESNRAYIYAVTLALRFVVELPPEGEERAEVVAIAERVGRHLLPKRPSEKPAEKRLASVTVLGGWQPRRVVASSGNGGPPRAA